MRDVALAAREPAYVFQRPIVLPDAATARALRRQLRALTDVLALAHGTAEVPAVRAALRSGLLSGLVTHAPVARALLDGA